jgi:transposase
MVCLDTRHAKKALDMKVNKTDANDAAGLTHLVRAIVPGGQGQRPKRHEALLGARNQLLSMSLALENQIRSILKTFGRVIMPLLQARQMAYLQAVARGWCLARAYTAALPVGRKWTTTATSRGVVIASCALCFTRRRLYS